MASLKDIKNRINSVSSTQKITSAMKMISSAKYHKAQATVLSFLPYQNKIDQILNKLLLSEQSDQSPYTEKREIKKIAIIPFSSNSALCGSFNANSIKEFEKVYNNWEYLGKENILIFPIGKKISDVLKKRSYTLQGNFQEMAEKPNYQEVQELSKKLIALFLKKEVDQIILIYHHFISMGTQKLVTPIFLPFELTKSDAEKDLDIQSDYIYEPSKQEILENLIPTVLYSRFYAALLESTTSEHAARTVAMQIATDNAEDLNHELQKLYNKTRQQSVTNELLDIIGGASALG